MSGPATAACKRVKKGTNRADVLRGTKCADTIYGLGGNDRIWGLGANDRIFGGGGHDMIVGGAGNDSINGGPGKDQIWGSGGRDIVNGAGGNDDLVDDAGNDRANGGPGADFFWFVGGSNVWAGGGGMDAAIFAQSRGPVTATIPNGTARVGSSTSRLSGFETIIGSRGNDTLVGVGSTQPPNPLQGFLVILDGGPGNDDLTGRGSGVGVGFFTAGGPVVAALGEGAPGTATGNGTDTLRGLLNLIAGDQSANFTGNSGPNALIGGPANDTLSGLGGNDLLKGEGGTDTLDGGEGTDTCVAGTNVSGCEQFSVQSALARHASYRAAVSRTAATLRAALGVR